MLNLDFCLHLSCLNSCEMFRKDFVISFNLLNRVVSPSDSFFRETVGLSLHWPRFIKSCHSLHHHLLLKVWLRSGTAENTKIESGDSLLGVTYLCKMWTCMLSTEMTFRVILRQGGRALPRDLLQHWNLGADPKPELHCISGLPKGRKKVKSIQCW